MTALLLTLGTLVVCALRLAYVNVKAKKLKQKLIDEEEGDAGGGHGSENKAKRRREVKKEITSLFAEIKDHLQYSQHTYQFWRTYPPDLKEGAESLNRLAMHKALSHYDNFCYFSTYLNSHKSKYGTLYLHPMVICIEKNNCYRDDGGPRYLGTGLVTKRGIDFETVGKDTRFAALKHVGGVRMNSKKSKDSLYWLDIQHPLANDPEITLDFLKTFLDRYHKTLSELKEEEGHVVDVEGDLLKHLTFSEVTRCPSCQSYEIQEVGDGEITECPSCATEYVFVESHFVPLMDDDDDDRDKDDGGNEFKEDYEHDDDRHKEIQYARA